MGLGKFFSKATKAVGKVAKTVTKTVESTAKGVAKGTETIGVGIFKATKNAGSAADGVQDAFTLLRNRRNEFESGMETLINGDPKIGLPSTPADIQKNELAKLNETWKEIREKIDALLNRQSALEELNQISINLNKAIPLLQSEYQSIIDI